MAQPMTGGASAPAHWTRQGLLIVALCFLINMVDGMDVNIMTFVRQALQDDWAVPDAMMGSVFSAGLLGMGLGALFIAPLADRFGRRRIIMAALVLMSAGMIACGHVSGLGGLVAARVVVGLGIGTVLAAMAALASESAPLRDQNMAVGIVQAGFPLAAVFTGFAVAALLKHVHWQDLLLWAGWLTVLMLPVAWLILPGHDAIAAQDAPKVQLGELFTPGLRHRTFWLWAAVFFGLMVLYFILSWITKLSIQAGLSETNSIYAGAIYNFGAFVGTMTMSWLTVRVSLGRLIPVLLVAAAVAMMIFATIPLTLGLALGLAFLIGVTLQGGYNGVWPLAASVYPSRCRATGIGLAMGIGRGGAVVGPWMGGVLMAAKAPLWALFAAYCVPLLICALAAFVIGRFRAEG
ncbi:MAG: MFS transporter [Sphingomonadales bacterium]|nr:MFS transporter [Sphingomonadales bacterium]